MATLKESIENQRKLKEAIKVSPKFVREILEAENFVKNLGITSTSLETNMQIFSTFNQIKEMPRAFLPQEILRSILKSREWIDTLKATSSLFLDSTNLEFSNSVTAVINEFDTYDFSDSAIYDDSQNDDLIDEILSNDSPSKLQVVKLTIIGFAEALKENPNIEKIIKIFTNPLSGFILGMLFIIILNSLSVESPTYKRILNLSNILSPSEEITEDNSVEEMESLNKLWEQIEPLTLQLENFETPQDRLNLSNSVKDILDNYDDQELVKKIYASSQQLDEIMKSTDPKDNVALEEFLIKSFKSLEDNFKCLKSLINEYTKENPNESLIKKSIMNISFFAIFIYILKEVARGIISPLCSDIYKYKIKPKLFAKEIEKENEENN